MVLPTAFAEAGLRSARLSERTGMRVGGSPEYLFEPRTEEEAEAKLKVMVDAVRDVKSELEID